ncbi:trmB [Symbiodinium microadriaticum]|nr:trmB [Symbiodinium microadriaticum]
MASCDGIIRDMVKSNPPISPNIRSVNTYFRGCLMTGSVCGAERMLARMQSDFRVPPDISSWEYVVALLCQALLLDKALPMIGRLKGDRSNSGGVGAMFVNLARAGALLGELKACKKALKQAEECLNADEELQMAEEADAAVDDEGSDYDSGSSEAGDDTGNSEHSRATLGGKRAWKLEEDDARAQSLECSVTRVLDYYGRVFSFDLQSTSSDTRNSLVDTLLLARVSKFGLAAALTKKCTAVTSMAAEGMVDYNIRRALGQPAAATLAVEASHTLPVRTEEMSAKDKDKAMRAKKKAKEKKKAAAATAALLESASPATCIKVAPAVALEIDGVRSHLTECVDEFGRLVFSKIFSNSCSPESGDGADSPRELPVKLEICSGGGEWAVKQAVADMGTANWITAEIRHDRVYQTFTRAVFEGASNLAVFGGDANEILARRIPAESLHFVCVNYPEPPQQLGGDSSQGKHLLTAEFFSAVENVLMPDGICTVVTDNLWYASLLLPL